jgi:hypothetical protein
MAGAFKKGERRVRHNPRLKKQPAVLQWANAREEFGAPTEQNVARVWEIARESGWVPQPDDTPLSVWMELRDAQPMVHRDLREIKAAQAQDMPPHPRPNHYDWSRIIVPLPGQANGIDTSKVTGSIAFCHWMVAAYRHLGIRGRAPHRPPKGDATSDEALSSRRSPTPPGLLHCLYDQLVPLFREPDGIDRLHTCASCGDPFIAATRRRKYCKATCRRQGNPTPKEKNRQSGRKYRDSLIPPDLKKVEDMKAKLRADGEDGLKKEWVLKVEWVLKSLKMDRRRWNSLVRWELERYGERRITDLTRPEVWEVVGLPKAGEVVLRGQRPKTAAPRRRPAAEQGVKPHPTPPRSPRATPGGTSTPEGRGHHGPGRGRDRRAGMPER